MINLIVYVNSLPFVNIKIYPILTIPQKVTTVLKIIDYFNLKTYFCHNVNIHKE